MWNIKRSRLFIVLAILFGLVPFVVGGFMSYLERDALEAKKMEYLAKQEQYKKEIAEYRRWMQERSAIIDHNEIVSNRNEIEHYSSGEDVVSMMPVPVTTIPVPDIPPVPRAPVMEKPEDPKEFSVSNWIASIGLGNGFLLAAFAWIWKRKENIEDIVEITDAVFKGENDLSKLTVVERLKMMIKSLFDKQTHARYRLRKNEGWSIYGSRYGIVDVPTSRRPFIVINRQQMKWKEIASLFGSLNASSRVEDEKLCDMWNSVARTVDLCLWKISLAFDSFDAAVNDAIDQESVIFIVIKDENNNLIHHTLSSDETFPPNRLESWELFVEQFRSKFYYDDKSAHLRLIFVAYPVV